MIEQRLTLIKKLDKRTKDNHIIGLYQCSCGNKKEAAISRVNNGYTRSCGCLAKERAPRKHGMRYTVEYKTWVAMRNRSLNKNNKDFYRYGHLEHDGILDNFMAFYSEVGDRPGDNYSIDRIDTTKGYMFGNVRWATSKEQSNNRINNRVVEIKGSVFSSIASAARAFNVSETSVHRWVFGSFDERDGRYTEAKPWARLITIR